MKTKLSCLPIWTIVALLLLPMRADAFPPAPSHLIYGLVRDELGNPVTASNAQLIFETDAGVKLTSQILYQGVPGQNYALEVPMDSGITSDAYMPTALRPTAPFKIRVQIAGVTYLPIEMTGNYATLGQPGKTTRINLTLGVDANGDGLPDAWQRNVLLGLGLHGTINDIKPEGDSDGDGMSNLDEYIAGTYAFDKADGYALKIKAMHGNAAAVEFLGIRGRNYAIYASLDLTNWTQTSFRVATKGSTIPGPSAFSWDAGGTGLVQAEADSLAATGVQFFKLMVR